MWLFHRTSPHCAVPPPYTLLVERPFIEGELMFCVHDQISCGPVDKQDVQIPQLGGISAYPDQPFAFWMFVKVRGVEVEVAGFGLTTVSVTSAFGDQPQLSHSATPTL